MPRATQDKLNQITARHLATVRGGLSLDAYVRDCAQLLGLSSGEVGGQRAWRACAGRFEAHRKASSACPCLALPACLQGGSAKEQLAEVLQAVVLCKDPDACYS